MRLRFCVLLIAIAHAQVPHSSYPVRPLGASIGSGSLGSQTVAPTKAPTVAPTAAPTEAPTVAPTAPPTEAPTVPYHAHPAVSPKQETVQTVMMVIVLVGLFAVVWLAFTRT